MLKITQTQTVTIGTLLVLAVVALPELVPVTVVALPVLVPVTIVGTGSPGQIYNR
jgi:hypothetical protein